jgi:hypothetical protein
MQSSRDNERVSTELVCASVVKLANAVAKQVEKMPDGLITGAKIERFGSFRQIKHRMEFSLMRTTGQAA